MILILKDGDVKDLPDDFACRLIEQGKAKPVPAPPKRPRPRRKTGGGEHGTGGSDRG